LRRRTIDLVLPGLTRFFSPCRINPFEINPLRSIIERLFGRGPSFDLDRFAG